MKEVGFFSVLVYHWKMRATLNSPSYTATEAEFLAPALAIQERPSSPTLRFTVFVLIVALSSLMLWALFGSLDIVVSVSGKVIPSQRTKTISSVELSSLRTLFVREGQIVHAGDALIELDATQILADRDRAVARKNLSRLEMNQANALIHALQAEVPPRLSPVAGVLKEQEYIAEQQLAEQYADYRAKLERLNADVQRLQIEAPLAAKSAADYRELLASNDVSQHSWLEKEQASLELQGQLTDTLKQRTVLLEETLKEERNVLVAASKAFTESEQDAEKAEDRAKFFTLRSPVDGTVQQLSVHTVGAAIPAAQPLMSIVPTNDEIEIEAKIDSKNVGFVREGQVAEIKIDTFDYTKYGALRGRISEIGRDAVDDGKGNLFYPVKVILDRRQIKVDDRIVLIAPGMSVKVDIKTGERKVIEYVLSPLMQHKRESLHER